MRPHAPPVLFFVASARRREPARPRQSGNVDSGSTACRCDAIWLSENGIDPYHPKVLRASAGQWFRQPPSIVSLPERIEVCRRQSIQVLAATAEGQAFWDFDLTSPTLFLLGNEGAGLTPSTLDLADARISIPMAAKVESLNVGVVGTLLLYEAERQRRGRSIDGGSRDGKPPVYSDEWKEWIALNLMLGQPPSDLCRILVEKAFPTIWLASKYAPRRHILMSPPPSRLLVSAPSVTGCSTRDESSKPVRLARPSNASHPFPRKRSTPTTMP